MANGSGTLELSTLGQIGQHVTDLGRAVDFYRDSLGARLITRYDAAGMAFFDLDGVRLMLSLGEGDEAHGHGSPLYFRVQDIDAACAELKSRGVEFEQGPHLVHRDDEGHFGTPGAELWMASFRDPDGNVLALMSEVAGPT